MMSTDDWVVSKIWKVTGFPKKYAIANACLVMVQFWSIKHVPRIRAAHDLALNMCPRNSLAHVYLRLNKRPLTGKPEIRTKMFEALIFG